MESLYARYIAERLGQSAIEHDWGFVTYRIEGALCEMIDIYVIPEERKGRRAWALVDEVTEVALQQGCTKLFGYVWPVFPGAEISMSAHLAYGFRFHSIDGQRIIMQKDIGG